MKIYGYGCVKVFNMISHDYFSQYEIRNFDTQKNYKNRDEKS